MVDPVVEEVTLMGTIITPVAILATLADIRDLETILHPIPTGMTTLGLEHEVYVCLNRLVLTLVPVSFLLPFTPACSE